MPVGPPIRHAPCAPVVLASSPGVSLRFFEGVAIIGLVDQDIISDEHRLVEDLLTVFDRCIRQSHQVRFIILWMDGVKEDVAMVSADIGRSKHNLKLVAERAESMHQLLVGFGHGNLSPLCSHLLAISDVSTATSTTKLQLVTPNGHLASLDALEALSSGMLRHAAYDQEDLSKWFESQLDTLLGLEQDELRRLRRGGGPQRVRTQSPSAQGIQPAVRGTQSSAPASSAEHTERADRAQPSSPECRSGPGAAWSPPGPPVTTMMIRHIPCAVTVEGLIEAVESVGFAGLYDLVHLPMGCRRDTLRSSNLGYGFINFRTPAAAELFPQKFRGYSFQGSSSQKVIAVQPARVQGFERVLQHISHNKYAGVGCCVASV